MHAENDLTPSPSPTKRLPELDSLRGVAACVVVLHHAWFMFRPYDKWYLRPLNQWYIRPFIDGHAAVILFFCLSGYVLSLSYWSGRAMPYAQYLTRRFFRIYVPYAVACAFAIAVGSHMLFAQLPLTDWFYRTWHSALTFKLIAAQFLTMSTTPEINTAFWSLRYEIEMSCIFPALCYLMKRIGGLGSAALALLCAVGGRLLASGAPYYSLRSECAKTLVYAAAFVAGALLAMESDRVTRVYNRMTAPLAAAVFCITVVAYFSEKDTIIIPGACMWIVFALHSKARTWLRLPLPEYLGKISYSLYLVHGTILFSAVILLYGRLPVLAIVLIYISISLIAADIFNRVIETPADIFGKKLARRHREKGATLVRT